MYVMVCTHYCNNESTISRVLGDDCVYIILMLLLFLAAKYYVYTNVCVLYTRMLDREKKLQDHETRDITIDVHTPGSTAKQWIIYQEMRRLEFALAKVFSPGIYSVGGGVGDDDDIHVKER